MAVDFFWIDATPVTNRQFRAFVKATGHRTTAETVPRPADYPGARCCQTEANSSQFAGNGNLLGRQKTAPLCESGGMV